jgi:hypothetical protein
MATVVTVLRSGGEFNASHVWAMQRQVKRWAPTGTRFVCLSDVPIKGVECYALGCDWPGWWAKMELFRPDLAELGDFLYTDLDNVIVGPIDEIMFRGERAYLQRGGWTALMWLPSRVREQVWDEFISAPEQYMKHFARESVLKINGVGNYGDAGFISSQIGGYREWEEALPGQVINIMDLRVLTPLGVRWIHNWPIDTRMILCGQPHRPWKMSMFWKLRLYGENL